MGQIKSYFFTFIFLLFFSLGFAQHEDSRTNQIKNIRKAFKEKHINSDFQSDSLSRKLTYAIFIQQLDPAKIFFTRSENDSLLKAYNSWAIESDLNSLDRFFNFANSWYIKSLDRARRFLSLFNIENVKLEQPDSLWLGNPYSKKFPLGEMELQNQWRALVKTRLLSLWNFDNPDENLALLESVIEKERCWLDDLISKANEEDFIYHIYLKAIAQSYDPHSDFYTLEESKLFTQLLSKSTLNFGFEVTKTSGGNIEIMRIIPGGAAWKCGEMKTGDEILNITDERGEIHEINCWSLDRVVDLLDDPTNSKLSFRIKKDEGGTTNITLEKHKTENTENLVNIYILSGERQVGYLALPSFYVNNETLGLFGSANDVTKAILKTKGENLEGLILDLRDNGGGSLGEAIGLASIFLNMGPICILNERGEKPILVKDLNRGSIYAGPMIVLVNEYSASASEVLAAALQDQNRALIVGQPTFGKSTGQNIIAIDSTDVSRGFLKITTEYIYRFHGESYQQEGVQPDILLAKDYFRYYFRESDYPNSLPVGKVNKKVYFEPPPNLPINFLQERYQSRISVENAVKNHSGYFIVTPNSIKLLREQIGQKLNYAEGIFTVNNNIYDTQIINALESEKLLDQREKVKIESDKEISECYQIMCDMINRLHQ